VEASNYALFAKVRALCRMTDSASRCAPPVAGTASPEARSPSALCVVVGVFSRLSPLPNSDR